MPALLISRPTSAAFLGMREWRRPRCSAAQHHEARPSCVYVAAVEARRVVLLLARGAARAHERRSATGYGLDRFARQASVGLSAVWSSIVNEVARNGEA